MFAVVKFIYVDAVKVLPTKWIINNGKTLVNKSVFCYWCSDISREADFENARYTRVLDESQDGLLLKGVVKKICSMYN